MASSPASSASPAALNPKAEEWRVTVITGIAGGFVPASNTLTARLSLRRNQAGGPSASVQLQDGAEPTPCAPDAAQRVFDSLQAAQSLPMEEGGVFNDDIYHQDQSLRIEQVVDGELSVVWANGAPDGCVYGDPTVEPTDDQIDSFKSLVAAVVAGSQALASAGL